MPLPSFFFLVMGTFLENIGKILMGVTSLLPTFPPSWNGQFWSYPSFHCITGQSTKFSPDMYYLRATVFFFVASTYLVLPRLIVSTFQQNFEFKKL